jgi:hypothetical protein
MVPTGHLPVMMISITRRQDLTALPYTGRLPAPVEPIYFEEKPGRRA